MLRKGSRLGKYRIRRRLADGGFAAVYEAQDTIEGIAVALKIPHPSLVTPEMLADFRREVRIASSLDHPNILPIRNAQFIGNHFVVASPLGEGCLGDSMRRRLSLSARLAFAEQILEAVAYAHERKIIHCDVKPENFVLFSGSRLRLADFGIARLARTTVAMSGAGTVGYIAPEQAVGKASMRSDVFSVGVILCEMFGGGVPEWPYEWPPPRVDRLRQSLHQDFQSMLRRALQLDPRKRYADAGALLRSFRTLKGRGRLLAPAARSRQNRRRPEARSSNDWRALRQRQFVKRYGRALDLGDHCGRCRGPISESMLHCPWCGAARKRHTGATRRRLRCPRCKRGRNPDWRYCPWCWGPGFAEVAPRPYKDRGATARCANPDCSRRAISPLMRYCPWCHTKVHKPWKLEGRREQCGRCGWGVLREYWTTCPWCGAALPHRHATT
jgi:eukaryotic-like serine/threonine-protein kinase